MLTTPFDVAKTRIQVDTARFSDNAGSVVQLEKRIIRVLGSIYKQEGLKGWMRGVGPRVAKVSPVTL